MAQWNRAMTDRAKRIFEQEIADGVIHGATILALDPYGEEIRASCGWADAAHARPMTPTTVIDVASVTKATAGVTAFLVAHRKGLVDFDAPLADVLPIFTAPLSRQLTIRDLANHISGYGEADGWPRVYVDADPKKMLANVLSMPPAVPEPGKVMYSCRNYILLGQALEAITGQPLAQFCHDEVFVPAGMTDTSLGAPASHVETGRLAQTMDTPQPGIISDFVARPMWAAGIGTFNAGLFSTAEDLAKLMRVYLRGGVCDGGTRLFGEAEMAEIAPLETCRTEGARSFGWQYADEYLPESLSGTALFHSGWSGQTVLFDLKRKRAIVVLTTRCGDYDRAKRERFEAIATILD